MSSDLAESEAQVVRSNALSAPLASLGYATTGNPSNPSQQSNALNLDLLADQFLELGGVQLPVFGSTGLLNLGSLGALNSFSESLTQQTSRASSGVLGDNGAIAVDQDGGVGTSPAYLDLIQLMKQLNITGLTDQVLDQARLDIGALATEVAQNTKDVSGRYAIAGLELGLRSPLVGSLPSRLETALTEAVAPINDLVASDGLLTELLGTIKKTINDGSIAGVSSLRVDSSTVTLNGLETAVKGVTQELLGSPISNSSGSLTIDLSTGMIKVDLAKLLKETGVGDLNNLPPNTNLLSDTSIEAVLQGIAEAVQGLTSKVAAAATSALNNVKVTMNLGVSAGCTTVLGVENCLAKGEVTVTGSLADFSGSSGTSPAITTTLAAAGIDFGTGIVNLVKPVLDNAIATTTGPLLKTAIATVTDQLPSVVESTTAPILSTLEPILKQALAQAVRVTINEQPTAAPRNGVGDLGPGSFTMRALSMELLPELAGNTGSPLISLGSASVRVAEAPDANANTAANANASSASNANANASSASNANANASSASNANANASSASNANANASSASNANANASSASNANANASSASNANTAANGSGSSLGALAVTGSNDPTPLLLGAGLLGLLGAGLLMAVRTQRNKKKGTPAEG
ncbi:choice-of-anchor G family protein [Arthrobacter russicus]|uniref:choice-of-anchor G family protein n=1 Tax=Arthrobacter russicus TaxID=172040 RepID=UPI0031E00268